MKTLNKSLFNVLLISVSALILLNLGCQSDTPSSPSTDLRVTRSSTQLHFLQPSEMEFNKTFRVKQYISENEGGTIVAGDEVSGYMSLDFMPGDLNYDTIIIFKWDTNNFGAEFAPHGISFNNPVRLNLSYKTADVSAIDEESIRLWYYNENENNWELVGGDVDTEEKEVSTYISHFSRYALAGED
jgi:hypothetical protein